MATTLSLAEFRTRFPEFTNLPDALVSSRLEWANAELNEGVWGDERDIGLGFLTAHYCALAPRGEDMRLKKSKDSPTTFYYMEYKRWLTMRAGGARISAITRERNKLLNNLRNGNGRGW